MPNTFSIPLGDGFVYHEVIRLTPVGGSGGGKENKHIGLKSTLAGGIAGAAQILATYPLDYVKTQLQLDEKGHNSLYNGTLDCMRKTYRQRGFCGFYRGMAITLFGCVPKVAVRFHVFERLREIFSDSTGQLHTNMKLLSGFIAGAAESIVAVTPSEAIKVKFINDERSASPQYRGLVHGVKTIWKNEGIRGIYMGLTPTILKEGSNMAVRFYVVESLKEAYTKGDRNKHVPMVLTGIFGAFGGALSVMSNNPIDVIKTRMQGLEASRYRNTWDCGVKIYKNEGMGAFWKGLFPRMYRVSLDVAITFVVYDNLMEWFHKLF